MATFISPSLALVVAGLLLLGFVLYRASIPTPIPGIPYFAASASRPFGDVPDAMRHLGETKQICTFLTQRCVELQSPICQVFMRPFSKPWVVVADSREAQDIMGRRTREFDRSEFFGDLFSGTVPHNQVHMKTTDQWRWNRRLMADTMSPAFLQNVAGPQVAAAFADLLELWREKCKIANGRPISVADDVMEAMVDTIFASSFGASSAANRAQLDFITQADIPLPRTMGVDDVVEFPKAPHPTVYDAITGLTESSIIPMQSPLGRHHHWFALTFYPRLRRARKLVEQLMYDKLDAAWNKFSHPSASDADIKCAAELIVEREAKLAAKESRAPRYKTPVVRDELFGFIMAGHETTASTLTWGLKLLTQHQEIQQKLREHLKSAFGGAEKGSGLPSPIEIGKAQAPYLDAVIEEILRASGTVAMNVRVAVQDTQLLGHVIPKGTDIFMLTQGPSYTAPSLPVQESKRSKTSQQVPPNERWTGDWKESTLSAFDPDRWLRTDAMGSKVFDPQSGVQQTFGAGTRGCFGKKLARLMLRITITSIILTFDLQPLPQNLAGFEAVDVLTHRPQYVYLRLAALENKE